MDFKYEIKLDQKGESVIVTDATDWNEIGENRSLYTLIFGLVKYVPGSNWQVMGTVEDQPSSVPGTGLNNSDRSEVKFSLSEDGYYYVRVAYALSNSNDQSQVTTVTTQGSQIRVWGGSSYQNITYEELMTQQVDRNGVPTVNTGFSPKLEKQLDRMILKHAYDNTPVESTNFKNFQTGYSLLLGAISSLRTGSYMEYDDKIKTIHKLAKRWQ